MSRENMDWLGPLRSRSLIPEDSLAAFVVGSAARGWDNGRSDFDIYVIVAEEWDTPTASTMAAPLDPPRVRSERFYHEERLWEVTYWLDSQIDQMLAKVSHEQYRRGIVAKEVLSAREELALSRIQDCLPIFGEEWVANTRKMISGSAFRSFLVSRSLTEADDAVEDAMGQLESNDLESAALSARRALGFAVEALLEGQGEYGSPKWRHKRFKAASPALLSFDDYWALETMRDYDSTAPERWIGEVLRLCQEISMSIDTA